MLCEAITRQGAAPARPVFVLGANLSQALQAKRLTLMNLLQPVGQVIGGAIMAAAASLDFSLVSHRLDKYLTHERIMLMEKLLGILLAALAVQMVLNGLSDLGIIAMTGGGH